MKWSIIVFVIIIMLLFFAGCTKGKLRVERDGVVIEADISYLLQDKGFKSLSYNIETGIFTLENFGSETSEVVNTFVEYISSVQKHKEDEFIVPIVFH